MAHAVAELHRDHGVDLRMGTRVAGFETQAGRLAAVRLDDETVIPAELAIVGLGTTPNTAWLAGSTVLLESGVRTDAALRVLDTSRRPFPAVVAAGDVARWPHPLFDDEPVRVEHWSNATDHARTAARTLLAELSVPTEAIGSPTDVQPCGTVPSFWSDQYATRVLSVGLPQLADDAMVLEGDPASSDLVVGYGRRGRMVGAVTLDQPRRLATYRRHIAAGGPWPPHPTDEVRPSARPTSHPVSH